MTKREGYPGEAIAIAMAAGVESKAPLIREAASSLAFAVSRHQARRARETRWQRLQRWFRR